MKNWFFALFKTHSPSLLRITLLCSLFVSLSFGELSHPKIQEMSEQKSSAEKTSSLLKNSSFKKSEETLKANDIKVFSKEALKDFLDPLIKKRMEAWDIPGMAVAVVYEDKVIYAKGFGVAKKGEKESYTPTTIQAIHSSTKSFTAVLLLILVEQGKLSLSDKVVDYLPHFQLSSKELTQNFTIEDLLTHTSGLRHFALDSVWALGFSAQDMMDKLPLLSVEHKKGDVYGYQNIFYGIAGKIIEKVCEKPFDQILQEMIFTPLGMNDATANKEFIDTIHSPSSFAHMHQKVMGFFGRPKKVYAYPHTSIWDHKHQRIKTKAFSPYNHIFEFPATSGIHLTLNDMAKWAQMLLSKGKGLLSPHSFERLTAWGVAVPIKKDTQQFIQSRFQSLHYALGMFAGTFGEENEKTYIITGGTSGARSVVGVLPEKKLAIVILSNFGGQASNRALEEIQYTFYDWALGLKALDYSSLILEKTKKYYIKNNAQLEKSRQNDPKPSKPLYMYEGTYDNPLYGKIHVKVRGESLTFHHEKHYSWQANHWNGHTFRCQASDVTPHLSGTTPVLHQFLNMQSSGKPQYLWVNVFFEGDEALFKRVS
jgi:CubicO group peptidase (beta-lactamase class C family)